MQESVVGRNHPCPCGSGKRYKECHGAIERAQRGEAQPGGTKTGARSEAQALIEDARRQFGAGAASDAAASARRAIELDDKDAGAWNILGMSIETSAPEDALAAWQKARSLSPYDPEAHFRIGNFFRRRRDFEPAIEAYRAVLAIAPESAIAHNNMALALQEHGRLDEAEQHYRAALRSEPALVEALANLGDLCQRTGRFAEANTWLAKALSQRPNAAALWTKSGLCHYRLGRLDEAKTSFERAGALDPDDPMTLLNLASVPLAQNRFAEASPLVERALAMRPGLAEGESMLLYIKQQTCDWDKLDYLVGELRKRIAQHDAPPVVPHSLIALPFTQAELLTATRNWVERHIRPKRAPAPRLTTLVEGRLRIAYLGSDFRAHPFANLATEVIERHDRSRFEVFGYSFGADDGSAARARFLRAFDRFIDVRHDTFEETVKRIRDDRVAILIDTGGHVIHARNEIFALRAAPIQINCMFPGTLGADYYDYIMTDAFVTPPEQQVHFIERFMLLPHCYMPSDTKRPIGPAPTRAQCAVPDAGFVFCCFNASYKILAGIFDVWMRLLRNVAGSVLWLLDTDPTVIDNLRGEAKVRGVSPERIVFAPRVPLPEHLARHSVADLFLDTFPCNAHTTTNDALFTGLPVITCAGDTFASRVAGSHLRAIGLPELVTSNLADYEALACRLALEPALLESYRKRLCANRATFPLFDMAGYTLAFDGLLWGTWEEWLARNAVSP